MSISPPRFLVDENLRGLTRWLRFFGFDAISPGGLSDEAVYALAVSEDRLIVTMDSDFETFEDRRVLKLAQRPARQMVSRLLEHVGVPDRLAWFTRCTACNANLTALSVDEVIKDDQIPAWVKARPEVISACWTCPGCRRVYWPGSHFERTIKILEEISLAARSRRQTR